MRVKSIRLQGYKRFSDLTVTDIPESSRLVVLAGPNGTGKSSLFDGLRTWHATHGSPAPSYDESYHTKIGLPPMGWTDRVSVELHGGFPNDQALQRKLIYQRSAFRNEPEFELSHLSRLSSPLETVRVNRMIDNDSTVSDNYQRLVLETLDGVYNDEIPDDASKQFLRERLIGEIQRSMASVFPDLVLEGVGDPLAGGSFYFTKGIARRFPYKNLSGGEKAAFDLLLDMVIKRKSFDNTAWCIDEPETHLNTRIQGSLLRELMNLLPENSQLWLASHSIGYMSAAWEMYKQAPGSVTFIDFENMNFDEAAELRPISVDREFWRRTLDVALGDLASLVAPDRAVLCEGRTPSPGESSYRAQFDAHCYGAIFGEEFLTTDFISVGNNHEVAGDSRSVGHAVQTLSTGTRVIRVIDRDLRTDQEVEEVRAAGVRVLSRRHIESYLLDDEVLSAYCASQGREDAVAKVLQDRDEARQESIKRGNDANDCKSFAGELYTKIRQRLGLQSSGSTWEAFAVESLATILRPGMAAYNQLKSDIFES